MKKRYIVVMICMLLLFLFFGNTSSEDSATVDALADKYSVSDEDAVSESIEDEACEIYYEKTVLKELENTDIFLDSAIEHIFEGNVSRGKAGGYHYECIKDTAGNVIVGTEVPLNDFGVYKAQVEVDGIPKKSNKGYSTFFPKDMDPQEVVDAINEAYDNSVFVEGTSNTYRGMAENGLEIEMYLNEKGKIISAFPKE